MELQPSDPALVPYEELDSLYRHALYNGVILEQLLDAWIAERNEAVALLRRFVPGTPDVRDFLARVDVGG